MPHHDRSRPPTSRLLPPRWIGAAAFAAPLLALWPATAHAENTLGVDLSYNSSDVENASDPGMGVDVYFGPRLDLVLLTLTTELSAGLHDFRGAAAPTVMRGMLGARLGLGAIVRPSVFAHIGAGRLNFDTVPGGFADRTDVAMDVGAALDFTLLPLVDLGVQVSYNSIAGDDFVPAFNWTQAGAHVVFVFDSSS